MKTSLTVAAWLGLVAIGPLAAYPPAAAFAAEEDITWLIEYRADALPAAPAWTAFGAGRATVSGSTLHLVDDGDDAGGFRAAWTADPNLEIVVEARVKVGGLVGYRGGSSVWPWRDGAPTGVLVSNGRHQEGLVLTPTAVRTFTDRFFPMNTTSGFHDYRLVIRGNDMRIEVDGKAVIGGADAFWKPADSPQAFLEFGSSAKAFTGDSHWQHVRLGVRPPTSQPRQPRLKVTISEPWAITRADNVRQTRPYLYNMGRGLLLMSVAQGPDALYEPYGVLKSTDEGKNWTPIAGLDQIESAPQPLIRLADGGILGASRWTWTRDESTLVGQTVHLDRQAESFTMSESRIHVPEAFFPGKRGDVLLFDRHIFNDADGGVTAVVWSRIRNDERQVVRHAHLLRSTDRGKTWNHVAPIIPGGEPAVARASASELTAVIRTGSFSPLNQSWSRDGGLTWSEPVALEEGAVAPDLELMSNGVLACSYGRPASCIMFSVDQGRTWTSHRVVSDATGFNYTAIREISPGRLLYVHDAPNPPRSPRLTALYIDVERLDR